MARRLILCSWPKGRLSVDIEKTKLWHFKLTTKKGHYKFWRGVQFYGFFSLVTCRAIIHWQWYNRKYAVYFRVHFDLMEKFKKIKANWNFQKFHRDLVLLWSWQALLMNYPSWRPPQSPSLKRKFLLS